MILIDRKVGIALTTSPSINDSFSGTCDGCGDVMSVSGDVTGHGGGGGGRVRAFGALTPGGV